MTIRKGEATAVLKIEGLNKPGHAQRLRRAANRLDGVFQFDINYIIDTVTIKYDADKLTSDQVKEKLALGK